METNAVFETEVVFDMPVRVVIDQVGTEERLEYRCSLYGLYEQDSIDLVSEGWGDTPLEATNWAVGDLLNECQQN